MEDEKWYVFVGINVGKQREHPPSNKEVFHHPNPKYMLWLRDFLNTGEKWVVEKIYGPFENEKKAWAFKNNLERSE